MLVQQQGRFFCLKGLRGLFRHKVNSFGKLLHTVLHQCSHLLARQQPLPPTIPQQIVPLDNFVKRNLGDNTI